MQCKCGSEMELMRTKVVATMTYKSYRCTKCSRFLNYDCNEYRDVDSFTDEYIKEWHEPEYLKNTLQVTKSFKMHRKACACCTKCEAEYDVDIHKCTKCGSTNFYREFKAS